MSQLGIDPQPALAQVLCQRAAGVMPEAGSGLNEEALVAPGPPDGAQQGQQQPVSPQIPLGVGALRCVPHQPSVIPAFRQQQPAPHGLLHRLVGPAGCRHQDEAPHQLRCLRRQVLRHHSALGDAEHIRTPEPQLFHGLRLVLRHPADGGPGLQPPPPAEQIDLPLPAVLPAGCRQGQGRLPDGPQAVPQSREDDQDPSPRSKSDVIHLPALPPHGSALHAKHRYPSFIFSMIPLSLPPHKRGKGPSALDAVFFL